MADHAPAVEARRLKSLEIAVEATRLAESARATATQSMSLPAATGEPYGLPAFRMDAQSAATGNVGAADTEENEMPPWKMLKASALRSTPTGLGGVWRDEREVYDGVNRYSSLAVPYEATDPVTSTYFQVVISKAKAPIVCGDAGPAKGKALYADRMLPRATRIWTEAPFVAMQHERNRGKLRCCAYCFLPLLGDVQRQWQEIVTRWNLHVASRSPSQPQSTSQDPNDAAPPSSTQETPATDSEKNEIHTELLDAGALTEALRLLHISPHSCGLSAPGARCVCGEVYCSKLCKMRAFHEYHALLCPREDPCSSMGMFLEHMRRSNDIFLLVAKVIARVLCRYLVWRDIVKAREPMDMFYKKPWWEVVIVEHEQHEAMQRRHHREMQAKASAASSNDTDSDTGSHSHSNDGTSPSDVQDVGGKMQVDTGGHSQVDAGAAGKTLGGGEEEQQQEEQTQYLHEVLTLTHQLLVDALECNLVRLEREDQLRGVAVDEIWRCCASVLRFEFFAAQLGLFEMNNISLEVDHPFRGFLDILDPDVQSEDNAEEPSHVDDVSHILVEQGAQSPRLQPQPQLSASEQALLANVRRALEWEEERLQVAQAQQQLAGEEDGQREGDYDPMMPLGFPSVEGTALFPIMCTMNHSCDPNCTVLYTKNGDGHVVAIRDIAPGEELCICYIDVDMDLQAREAALREYKFTCFCSRCVEQRRQLEQQDASDLPVDSTASNKPKEKEEASSGKQKRKTPSSSTAKTAKTAKDTKTGLAASKSSSGPTNRSGGS